MKLIGYMKINAVTFTNNVFTDVTFPTNVFHLRMYSSNHRVY